MAGGALLVGGILAATFTVKNEYIRDGVTMITDVFSGSPIAPIPRYTNKTSVVPRNWTKTAGKIIKGIVAK